MLGLASERLRVALRCPCKCFMCAAKCPTLISVMTVHVLLRKCVGSGAQTAYLVSVSDVLLVLVEMLLYTSIGTVVVLFVDLPFNTKVKVQRCIKRAARRLAVDDCRHQKRRPFALDKEPLSVLTIIGPAFCSLVMLPGRTCSRTSASSEGYNLGVESN